MHAHGKRQRVGHEEEGAGANADGRECFDKGSARGEDDTGGTEHEDEEHFRWAREGSAKEPDEARGNAIAAKVADKDGRGEPLHEDQQQSAASSPDAVAAMADGVTESEILEERQHDEEGDGNGDYGRGSPEH